MIGIRSGIVWLPIGQGIHTFGVGESFMRYQSCDKFFLVLIISAFLPVPVLADQAAFPVDEGFLSIAYEDMRIVERPAGFDLVHVSPGAFEKLSDYDGVIIDQPEIWIDRESGYPGAQPDYLKAIADLVRDTLVGRLVKGGNDIVTIPGSNVVFMRIAITDLYLKKKKGEVFVYQPIGSVSEEEMFRTMLRKVDIIELAIQMEFVDSVTEELLGAIVIRRGELKKRKAADGRLDFDEFWAIVDEYADRVRCRFDNAKRPKDQWLDCQVG